VGGAHPTEPRIRAVEYGNLLNWVIFSPTIAAAVCLVTPRVRAVKIVAVVATGITFLLSLGLFRHFAWWAHGQDAQATLKIGRASCRERV
jgi:NADH:ubiquinone oxidoreductase subunit 4 (subunit M)